MNVLSMEEVSRQGSAAALPATGGDLPASTYLLIAMAALGLVLLVSGLALRFLSVRR